VLVEVQDEIDEAQNQVYQLNTNGYCERETVNGKR